MGISLSSVPDAIARIGVARDVAFGTYFLMRGRMTDALLAAAKRGAHVAVTAQANPYGGTARDDRPAANLALAGELRAAGAEVTLLDRDARPFHLKAAVCDDAVFFDDRNWTGSGRELVIDDENAGDAAVVRAALAGNARTPGGHGAETAAVATTKGDALAREAALLDDARSAPAIVETETIGNGPLSHALRMHAKGGAATTLIVRPAKHRSFSERKTIHSLRRDGVTVLTSGTDEKLAVAGDEAWVGSANGTGLFHTGRDGKPVNTGDQVEWGLRTREPQLVDAVRAALARDAGREQRITVAAAA